MNTTNSSSGNIHFHEADTGILGAKREYTAINSLTVSAGVPACLNAVEHVTRGLYHEATNATLPYEILGSHQPSNWIRALGLNQLYSQKTQVFMDKIRGTGLSKTRFPVEQAYKDYTNPKSSDKAGYLLEGAEAFVNETCKLSKSPEALLTIQNWHESNK